MEAFNNNQNTIIPFGGSKQSLQSKELNDNKERVLQMQANKI